MSILLKAAKKDKRQKGNIGIVDWDHKAYRDAPKCYNVLCSCPMKRVSCTLQ